MLLGEWQRFNKTGWKGLINLTILKHLINLIFKLLLEGKDLKCSFESWWRLGDFFFAHKTWLRELLEIKLKHSM